MTHWNGCDTTGNDLVQTGVTFLSETLTWVATEVLVTGAELRVPLGRG